MKCKKCGAILLDTDTFCVKCGQKTDAPMFCPGCGEQLREGERFCHKCGIQVEADEEIPLSQQRTVDIPFDQIEQGILMEAEQAIVKRPNTERMQRRDPEDYSRPGAQASPDYKQAPIREPERCETAPTREPAYYESGKERERYIAPARQNRQAPPRYEEDYERYEDYEDDEEDEDSGDSKMKVITTILGIIVVAVALAIGFILWQRVNPFRYDRPGEGMEQGEDAEEGGEDSENGGSGNSGETQGRIQILSNVNVRNKPTTEGSEVMMVAKQGETYEYFELADDSWYHIKLEDGREGYVSAKYVEDLD